MRSTDYRLPGWFIRRPRLRLALWIAREVVRLATAIAVVAVCVYGLAGGWS